MTTEYLDSLEEPERGGWVPHAVVSAVTLAALAVVIMALLWPVGRVPERPLVVGASNSGGVIATSTSAALPVEKGGLAELYDDLNRNDPIDTRPPVAPIYYLVDSHEHADAVLFGIHEAASIRAGFSEPYAEERVILLTSEEEETGLQLALDEQNTLRGGMGLPAIRVVDLRAGPLNGEDAKDAKDAKAREGA